MRGDEKKYKDLKWQWISGSNIDVHVYVIMQSVSKLFVWVAISFFFSSTSIQCQVIKRCTVEQEYSGLQKFYKRLGGNTKDH